jgi:hypothetical protein
VNDEVDVVHQDPFAGASPFHVRGPQAGFSKLSFDAVRDRDDLAVGIAVTDDEVIGDVAQSAEVEDDQVLGFLVAGSLRTDVEGGGKLGCQRFASLS